MKKLSILLAVIFCLGGLAMAAPAEKPAPGAKPHAKVLMVKKAGKVKKSHKKGKKTPTTSTTLAPSQPK